MITMRSIRILICFALVSISVLSSGCSSSTPVVVEVRDQKEDSTPTPPKKSEIPSLNGKYSVNVACDTDPSLSIKKITITDTKTVIDLRSECKKEKGCMARAAAPGQQTAFYIADPDTRTEYKLLNVEGVSLEPKWTTLESGEALDYSLLRAHP